MGTHSRYVFSFWAFVAKGLVAITILKNDTLPKRGDSLKISCLMSPIKFIGQLRNTWNYPSMMSAPVCFADDHVCTGANMNYSFTADNSGAYATIYSLDRLRDSGTWTCIGSDNLGTNSTVIIVYTSPKGVKYVQPIVSEADLGQESIDLICQTDNCTYPPPSILWFYLKNQQQNVRYDVSDGVMVNNTAPCDQFEAIYISTLHLTHGTTFQGNIPFKTKFVCGVQHPALDGGIQYSELSNYINFAVNLTSVTLKDMNDNALPSTMELVQGSVVILKCVTSTSRPTATVRWYIGSTNVISRIQNVAKPGDNGLEFMESNLTFTPSNNEHHNKYIYCQAYSSLNSSFLQSPQHMMFVKVQVPNITLVYDNTSAAVGSNLPVVNGTSITLRCETGPSRPASIIMWYKGNVTVQGGVIRRNESNGGFDRVISTLSFKPSNNDHEMELFCQGYNIDPKDTVTSTKAFLNVTVYVSSVTLIPGNSSITFLEGDQMVIKCITSPSRPRPQIRWWVGNETKTDTIKESISNSENLIIMESEITLMLNRSYRNRLLYCDTQVPEQGTWISSFKSQINVWFAPEMSVKVTPSIVEVNSEVLIECTAHGEPSSYKFYDWSHKLGNVKLRHIEGIVGNQSISAVRLPNITIADMGTYICSVDNGITGPNGGIVQSVEAQIDVTGVPVAFVRDTFFREINMPASIKIPFFSNPNITAVEFFRTQNNIPVANDTDTQVYHTDAYISTVFHNTDVVLQGMEAVLHFRSLKESDFGQYTLVLSNNIGNATLSVHLNASDPKTDANIGPSIAGIAGGIVGGVVVILVTGVVIFLWRRHNHKNKAADGDLDQELEERERPESGLVDNPVYEKSNPRPSESGSMDATRAMYATAVKPKKKVPMVEDPKNLYAQVETTKKMKNKRGEIYENAYLPKKRPNQEDVYENSRQIVKETSAENLYEDSGASVNVPQVNKGALLYADLKLDLPTIKNGKHIIHGLENRTEYAELDYGKRGDPLPDNNVEEERNGGAK